jgi:hypothetical protein
MASADFSKRIPWPCGIGSLIARHVWRSPRVRRNPFPRLPPDLPMSHPSGYRASLSMARLPCEHRPCIRFLFVGSEFCLRLPPDLASRQRPCLQLTVPTTTACSGLAPYRITSCLAHQAMAPPLMLILSMLSVRPSSRIQYRAWEAKASLISHRPMSLVFIPARSSSLGMA